MARGVTVKLVAIFCAAALMAVGVPAAAATDCEAPADVLRYRVLWGGDEVGSHELSFSREGDALRVRSRTDIDADMLLMDVLDLIHRGEEVWRANRMESYRGRTVDNGEVFEVSVEPEADGYRLTRNGRASHIPTSAIPGSLWCETIIGPPGEGLVVDLVKGRLRQVRIGAPESFTLVREGRNLPGKRFRISGGYDRELWFDESGIGLRARFPAKMGPDVVLELQTPRRGSVVLPGSVDPMDAEVKDERGFGK
ncbi:MAG: hypothetical protein HOK81_00355 [Rhodospirillaceae bacterium]|jgi:hypothetical protein|nr:hypothetical protein [Rhodospirillaceae bacterium]